MYVNGFCADRDGSSTDLEMIDGQFQNGIGSEKEGGDCVHSNHVTTIPSSQINNSLVHLIKESGPTTSLNFGSQENIQQASFFDKNFGGPTTQNLKSISLESGGPLFSTNVVEQNLNDDGVHLVENGPRGVLYNKRNDGSSSNNGPSGLEHCYNSDNGFGLVDREVSGTKQQSELNVVRPPSSVGPSVQPNSASGLPSILGAPPLGPGKDHGSSSFSSPIHLDPFEPMDIAFEQDDLLGEEDVIEVDSDDGVTARFLTRDLMSSQVDPVTTPEPEQMDSTPSLVS
ncbi:hypothetical protein L6452_01784 [Arctium lappa]|uniref:Uncharacterized protein n=1 Tax=Arctium lappa TaxID=4217 RepID=A0ACB9FIN0_ARCLA|nr:hypothetical protein L6452_01784 [Arctium lappa]